MGHVRKAMGEQLEKAGQRTTEMSHKYKVRSDLVSNLKEKIIQLKDRNQEQQTVYMNQYDDLMVSKEELV